MQTPPPAFSPAPAPAEMLAPPWQMLQKSSAATAMTDLHGRLTYVNAAWLELWGHAAAAEVVGRSIDEWLDPTALRGGAALEGVHEQGSWQGRIESRRADGSALPLNCTLHLLRAADGRPLAVMASFADRRPELAALEDIERQRRFIEAVIGSAGVLMLVLDADGRIVRFNAECERVSGWRADEVLGRRPSDTMLPPEIAQTVRREAFSAAMAVGVGATTRYTNEWLARDGRRPLIDWTNTVFEQDGLRFMISIGIDVSERRATELRLQRAQQVAQLGTWELDLPGGCLSWSEEIYRVFELDPTTEVASYDTFLSVIHPDDRARVDATYRESLRLRQPYQIEHRLLLSDGRIKWVEERCHHEFDERGRPLRSLGTVQDISERKRAQSELMAREEQLRGTLDAYPGWVAAVDEDLRYRWVNEAFARMLGLRPAQVLGRTIDELRGPQRAAEAQSIRSRLRAGAAVQHEHRHTGPDGHRRSYWVHYRLTSDGGAAGSPLYYAFGTDITELRQARERLEVVVTATRIGTWEWTAQSATWQLSDEMYQLLGGADDDGTPPTPALLLAAVHPDHRGARQAAFDAVLGGRSQQVECEFQARHRSGHWIWLLDRGRVVDADEAGRPLRVLGVTQDISTLKQHELDLQRANAELERRVAERTRELTQAKARAESASRAKSDFLSQMSHELRTPLNAIIGFGQLLELSELPAEEAGHVQEVMQAGRHLLDLINEVLDLATVEAGRLELVQEPISLPDLMGECAALMRPAVLQAGLSLESQVKASCKAVLADRGRLRQVLLNLLSNAVKYNRPGGRIVIDCSCGDGWCELAVSDTGAGLSAGQVARLFQPFERLGAARSEVQGTGIGLSVSKRLVELMGGQIGASSQAGQGSRFWLRLPTSAEPPVAPAEPPTEWMPPPISAAGLQPRRRLLYVEDNAANQRLMQRILEPRTDLDLTLTDDARGVVALALRLRPQLILMDIQLPHLDGYEVLALLRAAGVATPVLAISANAMPDDVKRGLAAGFCGYMTKPLRVAQLLARIDALLPPADADESG